MEETQKKKLYIILGVALTLIAVIGAVFFLTRKSEIVEIPTVSEPVIGTANVERIDIVVSTSFPADVQVIARGTLPDSCTSIQLPVQSRNGNTFNVALTTTRDSSAMCAEVIQSFNYPFNLDVKDLKKGTYTVTVNGVSGTFTLKKDNSLIVTPQTKG